MRVASHRRSISHYACSHGIVHVTCAIAILATTTSHITSHHGNNNCSIVCPESDLPVGLNNVVRFNQLHRKHNHHVVAG